MDANYSKNGTIVLGCSGGSDVGELADKLARKIARSGKAKMYCLSGLGGHIPSMVEFVKSADRIIAIDGCPALCARKIIEHLGLNAEYINIKDYGFQKGGVNINDVNFEQLIKEIGA